MSANSLFVTVLIALTVVAVALRVAFGPMPALHDADSRYAAAKFGSAGKTSDTVLMAVGDTPAGP